MAGNTAEKWDGSKQVVSEKPTVELRAVPLGGEHEDTPVDVNAEIAERQRIKNLRAGDRLQTAIDLKKIRGEVAVDMRDESTGKAPKARRLSFNNHPSEQGILNPDKKHPTKKSNLLLKLVLPVALALGIGGKGLAERMSLDDNREIPDRESITPDGSGTNEAVAANLKADNNTEGSYFMSDDGAELDEVSQNAKDNMGNEQDGDGFNPPEDR